jgi:hypothetical protein
MTQQENRKNKRSQKKQPKDLKPEDAEREVEKWKETASEFEAELKEALKNVLNLEAEIDQERKARQKLEEALEEAQENNSALEKELELERKERNAAEKALAKTKDLMSSVEKQLAQEKQARAEAEKAMSEAVQSSSEGSMLKEADIEKDEVSGEIAEAHGAEQRVSFVVRMIVDSQGQARRSEIEHIQSGKKKKIFPALDVTQLAAFMSSHLSATAPPEIVTLAKAAPPLEKTAEVRPEVEGIYLDIKGVEIYRADDPRVPSLVFNAQEEMEISVDFQLSGTEASNLADRGIEYAITVHANAVASGASIVLAASRYQLSKDVVDYSSKMISKKITPGLYRLVTLVVLKSPERQAAYYEGPTIHMTGLEQPAAEISAAYHE